MERITGTLRQRLRTVAADAMLRSAEREMIRRGFERATMSEIAAATGCAAGTFYLYFENKRELFQAIVARHATAMFAAARSAVEKGRDPLEKLRLSYAAFLSYVQEHRGFFRMFFTALPMRHRVIHEKLGGTARKEHDAYNRFELGILRDAQRRRLIRSDLPAKTLQEFMDAVTMNMVERFVYSPGRRSAREQSRILWSLVGAGLQAADQRRHGRNGHREHDANGSRAGRAAAHGNRSRNGKR